MKRVQWFAGAICGMLMISATDVLAQETGSRNLAENPGFEAPINAPEGSPPGSPWETFTSKINRMQVSREAVRTGEQSIKFSAQKIVKGYQGMTQHLPVTAGTKYSFFIYAMSDKNDPMGGSAHLQLVIEWLNADGKEIGRDYSAMITSSLSRMRWELMALRKKAAPSGVASARFGIHLSEGEKGGKGSVFVDDAFVEE